MRIAEDLRSVRHKLVTGFDNLVDNARLLHDTSLDELRSIRNVVHRSQVDPASIHETLEFVQKLLVSQEPLTADNGNFTISANTNDIVSPSIFVSVVDGDAEYEFLIDQDCCFGLTPNLYHHEDPYRVLRDLIVKAENIETDKPKT